MLCFKDDVLAGPIEERKVFEDKFTGEVKKGAAPADVDTFFLKAIF